MIADDNKPKRNDLPARAAKRIISVLFPVEFRADDPKYYEHADILTKAFKLRLEQEITRVIWDEMIHLEGERMLVDSK